jgi:GT2 family glycosyltransferase
MPVVSIVIPVFNKWEYTAPCLRAVAENTRDVSHEVIVIDNASSDQTARALPGWAGIRTHRNAENLGFAKACNQGAALATGRFVLFLNNDTQPHPGWAAAMVAEMERDPAVAIVGSKLLYPDGTIQHAGVVFAYAMWQPIMPIHVDARQPAATANARRELNAVTAACMLVRPEIFHAIGGFDEGYVNGYEDVDLCLEVRSRGGKIVFAPASVVTHHESVSEGRFDSSAANTERLMARWIDRIDRLDRFTFDVDFRTTARPLVVPPQRPGVSVVVVADRSIWTIANCLENIWYTTGAQDQIVIVDDSGGAAAGRFVARFAARHPDRVRLVASGGPMDGGVGFPRAFAVGLDAATRPLAAVVGPNVRVVGDWLARLVAHLAAHRRGDQTQTLPAWGAITATLGDSGSLGTQELLWPSGRTEVTASAPPADLVPTSVAPSFTLFGPTDRLRALAAAPSGGLFGGANPAGTAAALAAHGLRLARAPDVVVYRLNEIAAGADPALRERYLALQGATHAVASHTGSSGGGDATTTPGGAPSISVILVAQGDAALITRCLRALDRHTDTSGPVEIIVVDNSGTDQGARAAEDARADPRGAGRDVIVIANARNEGFAFACNQGLDRARGQIIAIVHDDVVVGPGWLNRAVALLAAEPTIGMVGPASNECPGPQRIRMASYNGADEAAAFATLFAAQHQGELVLVPRLAGVCLIVRREVVMRVGGFDTGFGLGKGADDDLCVRVARAGWKMAIALDVFVHHQGGASYRRLGQDPRRAAEAGWRAFCAKWNHPPGKSAPGDLAALGTPPFDLARDRVPLRYGHIYCPQAEPLILAGRQPLRFLCIADDIDPTVAAPNAREEERRLPDDVHGWLGVLLRFMRAFTAHDPVALIVRVEPATPGAAERTVAQIGPLLGPAGISVSDAPEVLIEATPLPPARRGSIYTAARVFLRGDGPDDPIHTREAAACGLTIIDPGQATGALRAVLAMAIAMDPR